MAEAVAFVLSGRDGYGMAAEIPLEMGIVLINRFLEPGDVIGLHQLAKLRRD
jgi:hypothetical protein